MTRNSSTDREDSSKEPPVKLLSLMPSYDEARHQVYVDALEEALNGENSKSIRNIALTGSFGVGKSSILQKAASNYGDNIVQISLSTLGFPEEETGEAASTTGPTSETNRIQKEIVKQLLYRVDPDETPGSRFKRIERFSPWRGLGLAALAALALTFIFFVTGWTSQLVEVAKLHTNPDFWTLVGVFVHPGLVIVAIVFTALIGFVYALKHAFHNRVHIAALSAGSATISLSSETATYFDQYLDEIVYFFEVTRRDIVVFEDIDRFDDPHIFETLRALNTLLNGASQLHGQSIRFIYAIKDSIFDELGARAAREEVDADDGYRADAAVAELARANRTKFFDLVIPVVPFITHRSARDLMTQTMGDIQHKISPELIDLAARHLADMRLIKNIRNEFVIFRKLVLRTDDGDLALEEDSLFAMVLYKNTHLSDFEAIKAGTSNLDQLYEDGRKLVAESIAKLNHEARECRQQLANLNSIESRSEEYGSRLVQYIERVYRQLGTTNPVIQFTFQAQTLTNDDLRAANFWQRFTSSDGENLLALGNDPYSARQLQLCVTVADASEIVGDSLSVAAWQESDRDMLTVRLIEIEEQIALLSHADMHDLFEHDEFRLKSGESFQELAKKHLGSALAVQLVENGYIDRDFTIYTSTYYTDLVSTRSRNFIIHNANPNIIDMHFQLESNDVDAIIRE